MGIFTHVTVGSSDLNRSRSFYDTVLEPLGLKRLFDFERGSAYGQSKGEFIVITPLDGKTATAGNGVTVSFAAPNRAAVDEFHKRALAAGGTDEGAPGPRPFAATAYAAYARDLEGHKIVAITHTPA